MKKWLKSLTTFWRETTTGAILTLGDLRPVPVVKSSETNELRKS